MAQSTSPKPSEHERNPVPNSSIKGPGKFWGMYAGEHTAGTEFMIGPLFLLAGVTLPNIIFGLLVGNFMAVLSWRFLCAPIATKARLTLYYHLEKIAGPGLVKLYNFANGLLFCFLAGAMITVSATAVGIPFEIPMPTLEDTLPNNVPFVIITLLVGAVIAIVASRGYDTVARFSNVAAPWMVLVFLACGVIALKQLEVSNWAELTAVWNDSITFAQDGENESTMGFWSVMFFAWFCNAAMHVGMADLSVFRYAKNNSCGWASAAGMYIGHYMAWIAAALMLAAQIKLSRDANPVPGPMAANVAGLAGIICVIVAGWTTANPTIYRAGLAFQAMFPGSNRTTITLIAGGIATIAGIFPAFAWQLLGFVGLYGLILAPMGAIIFFDWHYRRNRSAEALHRLTPTNPVNMAVLFAWLIPISISLALIFLHDVTPHYCTLPSWIATGILYLVFTKPDQTQ